MNQPDQVVVPSTPDEAGVTPSKKSSVRIINRTKEALGTAFGIIGANIPPRATPPPVVTPQERKEVEQGK